MMDAQISLIGSYGVIGWNKIFRGGSDAEEKRSTSEGFAEPPLKKEGLSMAMFFI